MQMNPKTQLVLIGVSGLFAILFDLVDFSIGFYCTKPLTTLIDLDTSLALSSRSTKEHTERQCLWGLLFCLIGDSFLLFESFFLYGLTSFLIGHLCFLYAFVKQQGFQWPCNSRDFFWVALPRLFFSFVMTIWELFLFL